MIEARPVLRLPHVDRRDGRPGRRVIGQDRLHVAVQVLDLLARSERPFEPDHRVDVADHADSDLTCGLDDRVVDGRRDQVRELDEVVTRRGDVAHRGPRLLGSRDHTTIEDLAIGLADEDLVLADRSVARAVEGGRGLLLDDDARHLRVRLVCAEGGQCDDGARRS